MYPRRLPSSLSPILWRLNPSQYLTALRYASYSQRLPSNGSNVLAASSTPITVTSRGTNQPCTCTAARMHTVARTTLSQTTAEQRLSSSTNGHRNDATHMSDSSIIQSAPIDGDASHPLIALLSRSTPDRQLIYHILHAHQLLPDDHVASLQPMDHQLAIGDIPTPTHPLTTSEWEILLTATQEWNDIDTFELCWQQMMRAAANSKTPSPSSITITDGSNSTQLPPPVSSIMYLSRMHILLAHQRFQQIEQTFQEWQLALPAITNQTGANVDDYTILIGYHVLLQMYHTLKETPPYLTNAQIDFTHQLHEQIRAFWTYSLEQNRLRPELTMLLFKCFILFETPQQIFSRFDHLVQVSGKQIHKGRTGNNAFTEGGISMDMATFEFMFSYLLRSIEHVFPGDRATFLPRDRLEYLHKELVRRMVVARFIHGELVRHEGLPPILASKRIIAELKRQGLPTPLQIDQAMRKGGLASALQRASSSATTPPPILPQIPRLAQEFRIQVRVLNQLKYIEPAQHLYRQLLQAMNPPALQSFPSMLPRPTTQPVPEVSIPSTPTIPAIVEHSIKTDTTISDVNAVEPSITSPTTSVEPVTTATPTLSPPSTTVTQSSDMTPTVTPPSLGASAAGMNAAGPSQLQLIAEAEAAFEVGLSNSFKQRKSKWDYENIGMDKMRKFVTTFKERQLPFTAPMFLSWFDRITNFTHGWSILNRAEDSQVYDLRLYHRCMELARGPYQMEKLIERIEGVKGRKTLNLTTYRLLVLFYLRRVTPQVGDPKISILLDYMEAGGESFRLEDYEAILTFLLQKPHDANPIAHKRLERIAAWTARVHKAGLWNELNLNLKSQIAHLTPKSQPTTQSPPSSATANSPSASFASRLWLPPPVVVSSPDFVCCLTLQAASPLGGFFSGIFGMNKAQSCPRYIQCQTAAAAAACNNASG